MNFFAQTFENNIEPNQEFTTTQITTTEASSAAAMTGIVFFVISLLVTVLIWICAAKIYTKAGRKWWEAIVPVYNIYILQKIVGRPGWWTLLYFIPLVNIVVAIVNSVDLAKAFGKGLGTGLALVFLPIIMYPIMAFSDSYKYKNANSGSSQPYVQPGGVGNQTVNTPSGGFSAASTAGRPISPQPAQPQQPQQPQPQPQQNQPPQQPNISAAPEQQTPRQQPPQPEQNQPNIQQDINAPQTPPAPNNQQDNRQQ